LAEILRTDLMKEIIRKFAEDNSISEEIVKILLKTSFEKSLSKRYADCITFFNIESETFYIIKDGQTETKTIKDFRRRFILMNKSEFAYLLNQAYPEKFKLSKPLQSQEKDTYEREYYEDGPYCSACQQAPCMCSDREATSTVHDF
jgi:hypothetical protein